MAIRPQYQFPFFCDGQRGEVSVFPACTWVRWAGMDFEIDAVRGALALAIFKGRMAYQGVRS